MHKQAMHELRLGEQGVCEGDSMETQCTHLHREYKPVHNVNAIRQNLECKSQQSTFGMQTHTMRKPLLCTSKQCTSSVWLPRAFRGLVGATCRARAGCGGLVQRLHRRDLPHNRNFFARCCWQCLGCLLLMVSGQIAAPAAVWACSSASRTNAVFWTNGGRVAAPSRPVGITNFFAVCCSQCLSCLIPMAGG